MHLSNLSRLLSTRSSESASSDANLNKFSWHVDTQIWAATPSYNGNVVVVECKCSTAASCFRVPRNLVKETAIGEQKPIMQNSEHVGDVESNRVGWSERPLGW
jgi:hypothetical protein